MSSENLEYLSCPTASCGGQWLPAAKLRQLRESHETFYCPSGHNQYFPEKTEKEKRIEALEIDLAAMTRSRNTYKQWWEQLSKNVTKERHKRYALKGYITKLKKAS